MDWATAGLLLTALGAGGVISLLIKARIDQPLREAETRKAQDDADHASALNYAQLSELFSTTAGKLVEAQNAQINALQKDFGALKAENAGLICEIGRLDGVINELRKENAMKSTEAERMHEEIMALKRQLADRNRKIAHLEAENALLRERVTELERKLEKLVGGAG